MSVPDWQKRDEWWKATIQRLKDAGIVREPTEAEWDEAVAPLVAQVLAKQEENVVAAILELAQQRGLTPRLNPAKMGTDA